MALAHAEEVGALEELGRKIDQLRPDWNVITASLGGMSTGERVFILSPYQFFSDSTIVDLCVEKEIRFPTLADIGTLDIERRNVISRLLATYHGW